MAGDKNKVDRYWVKNTTIIAVLLLCWFVASFVTIWFAEDLDSIVFFGWPLSFYMAAQGSVLIYLLITWIYARLMSNLDRNYGFNEGEDK